MVLLFVLIAEEWSMSKVQIAQKMFLLVISIYLLAFHVQEVKQMVEILEDTFCLLDVIRQIS